MAVAATVHPLRVRDFRLLWIGESISLIGDQFYLIALPWLVLQLTGNALALGLILALTGIPRALFMLVGGALVDRFSPRRVMFASNLARMALVTLLAVLALTDNIQLWMLYVLTLAFGTADAFYFPAQSSMVPALLNNDQLETGNTLTQSTAMLSIFLGPLAAGVIIGAFSGESSTDLRGIGIVFALDALSFLASLSCLWLIGVRKIPVERPPSTDFLGSIKEGVGYVRRSITLQSVFVLYVAMYLFINGPFDLGVAVLAKNNLAEGAAAFGFLFAAYGAGALVGVLMTSILPQPSAPVFGTMLMGVSAVSGIAMMLMPVSSLTPVVAVISLGIGAAMGFVEIHAIIWLQRRIPDHLMGRVMSLITIASFGVAPIANALAGVIAETSTTALFVGAGGLMTLTALALLAIPAVRRMGLEVAESKKRTTLSRSIRATSEITLTKKRTTGTMPAVTS
jgi:MFS family permease